MKKFTTTFASIALWDNTYNDLIGVIHVSAGLFGDNPAPKDITSKIQTAIEEEFNAENVSLLDDVNYDGLADYVDFDAESYENGEKCIRSYRITRTTVYDTDCNKS